MNYYAALLPMKDEEKSKIHRPDHLTYLEDMEKEGKVFAKGKFTDGAGGLVIYQAESLEEAEKLVKADPYVVNGARDYEVHEWTMMLVGDKPRS
ncbi:YciI family protein [Oceanobacillus manasiensis]|uniref:YciI family protein n=1 Tax=Oceanobacillus manasiensis TaxID=586413 RepID=UPI0005A7364E|nr:YciI family protein [Oceanobacillus manasiensis]